MAKKILNNVTTALLVLVLALAGALVGVRLFGVAPYTVLSGSMEPTYPVGSLIYVREVDVSTLKVGDPITFVLNEDLVVATHRVVEIDPAEREFTTKGDANSNVDANPVHFNNLVGVPVFSIPYLGYVSAYIQSPPGMYIAIGFGALLLVMVFLPDMLTKKSKADKKDEDAAPAESDDAQEEVTQ